MSERFYQEMFGGPEDGGELIGADVPRVDGPPKADGSPVFAADHKLVAPLYVVPVTAPVACGTLERIDTAAAENAPGVACILTSKDIPGQKLYGMMVPDQPALVEKRIYSLQDVTAVVAAETLEQAEFAAGLVKMKVRELPAVFDALDALKDDAPVVRPDHPMAEGNVLTHLKIRKGDVEAGFAEADVVLENTYETQFIDHAYLEPDAGYVVPNPDGSITCTGPTQCPHMVRRVIAPVLGLGQNEIQFISTPPGGGFGGKEETSIEIAMRAGLVALRTRRPAIYNYTREESLGGKAKRVPAVIRHKIGARKDGRITAVRVHVYLNKGPYAAVGPGIIKKLIIHSSGA